MGSNYLTLGRHEQLRLIESARDRRPVSGLTHTFYKYPARFSPQFVRAAIEAFTQPGEMIFDPFVGGGTTLVESLALNRDAVGVDISSLASFVSDAKTRILTDEELQALKRWAARTPEITGIRQPRPPATQYEMLGYFDNVKSRPFWRLRKCIELGLESITKLHTVNLQVVARCIILRTAQWALDSRKRLPSVCEFRDAMIDYATEIIEGAANLRAEVEASGVAAASVKCFHCTAVGFHESKEARGLGKARLVLTSPPYPGVHVLYHRWQVDGRKETPAPFWIANKLDGAGASYYTLGDRKNSGLKTYFSNLENVFASTVAMCARDAIVVQVVAFSNPAWQLERYLEVMDAVGLEELFLPLADSVDRRLWRDVPNRRWYADQMGRTSGSREVVLFHRASNPERSSKDSRPDCLRAPTTLRLN